MLCRNGRLIRYALVSAKEKYQFFLMGSTQKKKLII